MKRITVLLVICMIGSYSYAQKKPKVLQAEKARNAGNLGEAKEILDAAIEHEKTKEDGKTWYYRGLLYAALDTTTNPQYQSLASNPLETALASFAKAEELAKGGKEYFTPDANGFPVTKLQQIDALWGHYLNKGVENYQAEDYDKALEYFEKVTTVKPDDTTGLIYGGSVAMGAKKYDITKSYYNKLIDELDYQSQDIYNGLIYIATSIDKDDEEALKYIRAAKAQFPENTEFAKSEINALIRLDKVDEARSELEAAIKAEPGNANLIFTLGVMRDEIGDVAGAKEAYEQALAADPTHYNSQFNLAVLSYNEVVNLLKEKNNLGITAADLKKAKEMQASIDEKLKTALPQWEKTNELKSGDQTTLETLKYIYFNLKMYDKAEAIENELKALGTEGED